MDSATAPDIPRVAAEVQGAGEPLLPLGGTNPNGSREPVTLTLSHHVRSPLHWSNNSFVLKHPLTELFKKLGKCASVSAHNRQAFPDI
jgi:hypothetical protein